MQATLESQGTSQAAACGLCSFSDMLAVSTRSASTQSAISIAVADHTLILGQHAKIATQKPFTQ